MLKLLKLLKLLKRLVNGIFLERLPVMLYSKKLAKEPLPILLMGIV
jgi:hypothetical protein